MRGSGKTVTMTAIANFLKEDEDWFIINLNPNRPLLDTLILAAPLSWKNNLIQYASRLHRPYEGKSQVKIFDYLDIHVPCLERCFKKERLPIEKWPINWKRVKKKAAYLPQIIMKKFSKKIYKKCAQVCLFALRL